MKTCQLPVASCQLARTACGLALLLTGASVLWGQTTRPALQQLSNESRDLYQQVRHEVVRVETPMPRWMLEMAARENPMVKWGQVLDAAVRQQLMIAQQNGAMAATGIHAEIAPANQESREPTTAPSTHVVIGTATQQSGDAVTMQPRPPMIRVTARVNTIGLILDDQGHVLIPLYLDKESAGQGPIMLFSPDGMCRAKFVASDAKSNITIVQMEKMMGKPAKLEDQRTDVGSLVMILTPNQATAQLVVWTGANQEYGVVSDMDGGITGILRGGHLVASRDCKTIGRELIAGRPVKRALLGVHIFEVGPDDPIRQSVPSLGNRAAIEVKDVLPGSAAAQSDIRAGDLILQLAGQDIEDPPSFAAAIANRSGMTELQILRDGKVVRVRVNLKAQ